MNLNPKQFIKNIFSKNNSTARNLLIVASITLLGKFLGFFKETYIASSFGLSLILDTFFIAILVPGFIQNVFLGAFKGVFIPNYVAELKRGKNPASFQATGFLITIVTSAIFVLIAYLITDIFLETLFPDHDELFYSMIKSQFYFLAPCIFLWGISSLLSGMLNIKGEFVYSSLPSFFIPIITILFLAFFKEELGYNVLAIGTLVGSVLGILFLIFICLQKNIISISKPNIKDDNVQLMLKQVPAKVSSGFLTGMNSVVDQYFAAQLLVGSIAAINYGQKIPAFLIGILVVALNNVLLPKFSSMFIDNQRKAFNSYLKMVKLLFIVSTICAIVGILFSDFLVELFYERNKFTSEDSTIVSTMQKIFLIHTPFTICGMVVVNFLTSINKNAFMAYSSLVALILNIILDYVFIQYYGILGIAICTSVVIILKMIFTFWYSIRVSKTFAI